jgi:surfactin synthase thioesterase subunit
MSWLRDWSRGDGVTMRILCLPPAGGGAHLYRHWPRRLPRHIGVVAVELPGHGSRVAEPPLHSITELLADGLCTEVETLLDLPMVVFGHSMGAVVGFDLCRALRRALGWRPAGLVVAGCDAPDTLVHKDYASQMTDAGITGFLRSRGGTPEAILGKEEYLAMLRPVIRADLTALAGRLPAAEPPLACPVRVYQGREDPSVSPERLYGWAVEGDGDFAICSFPGGHFFVQESVEQVLARLEKDIREWQRSTGTAIPDSRSAVPRYGAPTLM